MSPQCRPEGGHPDSHRAAMQIPLHSRVSVGHAGARSTWTGLLSFGPTSRPVWQGGGPHMRLVRQRVPGYDPTRLARASHNNILVSLSRSSIAA